MPYSFSPGQADPGINPDTLAAWQGQITRTLAQLDAAAPNPLLCVDPHDLEARGPAIPVTWSGSPRDARDCLGDTLAAELADCGWPGRAELQNEHLEYTLLMRPDASGTLRPKRFVATTELAEWWRLMALHDIDGFLRSIHRTLRQRYSCAALFGISADCWRGLSIDRRTALFDRRLIGRGPHQPPEHPLNVQHALFLSNPANSLIAFLEMVHAGARAFVSGTADRPRRARIEEVFAATDRADAYCRAAPAALTRGIRDLILPDPTGPARRAAMAEPFGIYMHGIDTQRFTLGGAPLPGSWTRFSRGRDGRFMRLEFGPTDAEPLFLDDIRVGTQTGAPPLRGYDLAAAISVGPILCVEGRACQEAPRTHVPACAPGTLVCGLPDSPRSRTLAAFADLFEMPPDWNHLNGVLRVG
ncbi:hypothetical protein KDD17_17535 [Sulfitobacter albidus]|uniref:Uncharacterized protein n=1 Tax=Sulfitobacter albidus TaxID=2829501 RepID=A0A975JGL0_9RHOB|nr:hypothetical protein [Sulfitobacter albidus]QUJ78144.1 hypothetical protein KDD17_17535 [Sulfitobacter albidus]